MVTRRSKRIATKAIAVKKDVKKDVKAIIVLNCNEDGGNGYKKQKTIANASEKLSSASMPLRRSQRIASGNSVLNQIQLQTVPKKANTKVTPNRSTVSSGAVSEKKATDNGPNMKKNAIVKSSTFEIDEIVMAKMSGHMIWPAKVFFVFSIQSSDRS